MDIYNSTEEITETNKKLGIDVEYLQTGKGKYEGIFDTVEHHNSVFIEEHGSVSMHASGQADKDLYFFLMPQTSIIASGKTLNKGQLLVIPPGAEICVVAKENYRAYQACIPRITVDDILAKLAQEDTQLPHRQMHIDLSHASDKNFTRAFNQLTSSNSFESIVAEDFEKSLIHSLLDMNSQLQPGHLRSKGRPPADYKTTFKIARNYLSENLTDPNLLENLCMFAQSSLRTLERVFMKQIGITPAKYIYYLRVQAIHKELLRTSKLKTMTVQDIAYKYNINHMGRFSSAYYSIYNEYPGQTLKS